MKRAAREPAGAARLSRGRTRDGASFPTPPGRTDLPRNYLAVLADLKDRIATTQTRAALSVNREVVSLYWMRAFYLARTYQVKGLPQPAADLDGTRLPQPAAGGDGRRAQTTGICGLGYWE